jgi:hypothetical protein
MSDRPRDRSELAGDCAARPSARVAGRGRGDEDDIRYRVVADDGRPSVPDLRLARLAVGDDDRNRGRVSLGAARANDEAVAAGRKHPATKATAEPDAVHTGVCPDGEAADPLAIRIDAEDRDPKDGRPGEPEDERRPAVLASGPDEGARSASRAA